MKQYLAVIICALFCLISCDDDPAGTTSTGTLHGNIRVFDEKGNEISDKSGVTLSLKEKSISTTTNPSGAWTLQNVPMGTYTILVSKPGFDTTNVLGFQFNGMGEVRVDENIELLKPTVETISEISTKMNAEALQFTVTTSLSPGFVDRTSAYVIAVRSNQSFSWKTDDQSLLKEFHDGMGGHIMTHSIPLSELKSKFPAGTTVYASARMMHNRYGVRFDLRNNRYYTGLGAPSETISFVVP